jgi:hypothetical protein
MSPGGDTERKIYFLKQQETGSNLCDDWWTSPTWSRRNTVPGNEHTSLEALEGSQSDAFCHYKHEIVCFA